MFAKIAVLVAVACVLSGTDAQWLASPYAAYPAYSSAVYSPYAYSGVYTGYAGYYPAYYGWGSNKGAPAAAAPKNGPSLTNNQ